MRIATYNLWNSLHNWRQRLYAIAEELVRLDADIVMMQEAPTQAADEQSLIDFFLARTSYSYALHYQYPEEATEDERPEGLALLSKLPFELVSINWANAADTSNNWALKVAVEWSRTSLGITNVHLDWQNPDKRESAISQIVSELVERQPCEHELLLGDFNEAEDGPVASRLATWRDLAREASGSDAPVTLGFVGSPRETEPGAHPERFDRIYLKDRRAASPLRLTDAGVFGQSPSNHGMAPSDHLGAFVDLEQPAV